MKIGILTQPLHNNYGGLLQAYALQTVLKRMGHEVWTVDMWTVESKRNFVFYYRLLRSIAKRMVLRYLLRKPVAVNIWPTAAFRSTISQHTQRFIEENICTTEKINGSYNLSLLNEYNFDAYVVGSDQVWRPKYSPFLPHFFLDFLTDNDPIKRISYAASLGTDEWELTPEQTEICAVLAKKFDAISVREDSAVELCKKHLGVDAVHVLDPTLLLSKEDYIVLVEKDNIPKSQGNLISYVIDLSPEKKTIIEQTSSVLGLKPFFVNKLMDTNNGVVNDCIYPPVTQWLRGFMDAEFVITDSFHGTAFSILFNKPFLTIGNESRGLARFSSLLKIFGLDNRLVNVSQGVAEKALRDTIDWNHVNAVLQNEKAHAIEFLNVSTTIYKQSK